MAENPYKPDLVLLFTVTMLKSQARQISELSARITALALTVKGLDLTFDDVWAEKTEDVEKMLAPSRNELLGQYDRLLEAIKTGDTSHLLD